MRQEKELTLGKLFWDVVLGWRKLIVCGLIFSILLAGYKFVVEYRLYSGQQTDESDLTAEEQAEVEQTIQLQDTLLFWEEYATQSVRMNVDFYNVLTYRLRFYVDSDYKIDFNGVNAIDYTDSLVVAYNEYIRVGGLTSDLIEDIELDIEPKYLQEIISVTATDHVIEVKVIHYDALILERISTAVKNALLEQEIKLSSEVGAHSIITISEDTYVEIDKNLLAEQESHMTNMESMKKKYDSLVSQMSSAQLAVMNQEQEELENVVGSQSPLINIKYLVLGFVIGVVIAVFWILAKTIFSSKLQRKEELSSLYNMRAIANLDLVVERRKLGRCVDAWLLRIRDKKIYTLEQQIDILCANIEVVCNSQNIKKIYITGTELDKLNADLLSSVKEKLEAVGIQVLLGANICANIKSLKEMVEIGNVVIVEKVNDSLYDEIEKEVRIAKDNNVHIVGCIGVEE